MRKIAGQFLTLNFFVWCSAPSFGEEPFPPELVSFRPYPSNPVFRAGDEKAWDARIRERGWILKDGDLFHLWYTGYREKGKGSMMLGHASSSDGLNWVRSAKNPLYCDHWVEDMMVIKDGDRFLMFAEGLNDEAQLLTSDDGIAWKRLGKLDIRMRDGSPISAGPYGTPAAFKVDGTWHLIYERRDRGAWLAKSTDLVTWTNVLDEPVLRPGPDAYDARLIAVNQVVEHEGRYYAYYHGLGHNTRNWGTCVASSDDLLTWDKYDSNPLFPLEENKSSGIVVPMNGGYWLYTMHEKVEAHLPQSAP